MRGVLFNNANLIFDVQQVDPGAPVKPGRTKEGATATSSFANVYSGWQVIENAAVALDESVVRMLKPGRTCENGTPVPIAQADYVKTAFGLRQIARQILRAAQHKNSDNGDRARRRTFRGLRRVSPDLSGPRRPQRIRRHVAPLQGSPKEELTARFT